MEREHSKSPVQPEAAAANERVGLLVSRVQQVRREVTICEWTSTEGVARGEYYNRGLCPLQKSEFMSHHRVTTENSKGES